MPHQLDNRYQGLPIFVISTGTSLRGFDFSRLDGRITIGVNRVIEHYRPTIVHFVDVTAHQSHRAALEGYRGTIIAGPNAAPAASRAESFEINPLGLRPGAPIGETAAVRELRSRPRDVGRSFDAGLFGLGAGCTALHIAVLLGGDPIFLLGYDYYEDNGRYFDAYDESLQEQTVYDYSMECIERIGAQPWRPEIYNCNRRSKLRCFPFRAIDAALAEDPKG